MDLQIDLLIAQAINFFVLIFLFKYLVGDKLTRALVERRAKLAQTEQAEAEYEAMIQQAQQEKKQIIGEGVAHKDNLIKEAELAAQHKADAIIADAEKSAAQTKGEAKEHAQKLESQLQQSYVDGVKQTAHVVLKKLFKDNQQLRDAYVEEINEEFIQSVNK